MIRRCLIVDVETTGLDPEVDQIAEIGVVLYSVEHRTTLAQFSRLMPIGTNAAEQVNRIPPAALGDDLPDMGSFDRFIELADVFVAHNAEFDSLFLSRWREHPWLCTMSDFAWPAATREGGSLVGLALDHGIGVSSAHRALTDCLLIAALFDRMQMYGRDLQEMFTHAMRPKATFQALVSYDDREKAKVAGFKWDGASKRWTRRMAIEDVATLPFRTLRLDT